MSALSGSGLAVRLIGSKADAVRHLRVMQERGRLLRAASVDTTGDLAEVLRKLAAWTADATDLLGKTFDSRVIADGFNEQIFGVSAGGDDLGSQTRVLQEELDQRIGRLGVVLRRVEQMAEVASPVSTTSADEIVTPPSHGGAKGGDTTSATQSLVLISHGGLTNESQAIGDFACQLGLTISRVTAEGGTSPTAYGTVLKAGAFAVVALSSAEALAFAPDSSGQIAPETAFELGYVCGRAGAERVVVLYPADASGRAFVDANGITFVPLDAAGGWMLALARQMKKAGVSVDLNRML